MSGLCGSCTFCCTALGVQELEKQPWTPCRHASRGCGIYEDRPNTCRIFACVWRQDQDGDRQMPRSMRPDQSHVMLAASPNGTFITAYSKFPAAWRRGEMKGVIERTSRRWRVAVTDGTRYFEVWQGTVREMALGPPDEQGHRKYERYIGEPAPI